MPELKLKQFEFECETWNRTLKYLVNENIHLKNRLSEILKDKFDKYLLEEVEGFQNRFIREDELIDLIRNEIAELEELLDTEEQESEEFDIDRDRKIKKIRNNLKIAENRFSELKSDFNDFLIENIL